MSAQMIHSLSELKAKYKVEDIISSLEKNLENHKKDYKEALLGFRKKVLSTLEDQFDHYNKKAQEFTEFKTLSIHSPVNCEKGYEDLLVLFKHMTDDVIELDVETANHIFNDDWAWAQSAKLSNSMYLSAVESI